MSNSPNKTLVYFHSEGVLSGSDSSTMAVSSANLLDFFVYVARFCQHSVFYSTKREGNSSLKLTLPANAEHIALPIRVGGPSIVLRSVFQIVQSFLFDKSVKKTIAEADISVSVGLDGIGSLAGLARYFGTNKMHTFIVRGNRQLTVQQSSRGLLSKNFALLRIAVYTRILIFMVNRNRAEIWFQGELQRDRFRTLIATSQTGSLHVLNSVLRDIPQYPTNCKTHDLVFTGRITIEKGLLDLVEAVRLLRDAGRVVTLNLVGSGPDEEQLRCAVERYSLGQQVTFSGFVGDVEKLGLSVANGRLFVLPSHTEGLPRSMLESMWIGTPVLVTPVGGIPYVIKDGINGFLVESKNPEKLAKKICFALDKETSEIETLVTNAREVATRHTFAARAPVFLSTAGNTDFH